MNICNYVCIHNYNYRHLILTVSRDSINVSSGNFLFVNVESMPLNESPLPNLTFSTLQGV